MNYIEKFNYPRYPSRLSACYAFGNYDTCVDVSKKYNWPLTTVRKFRLLENPYNRIVELNMEIVSLERTANRISTIFFKMEKFGLSKEDIASIKEVFEKYGQLEEVLIYGSRAMGTYKPSSDIDLTLIGKDINSNVQQQIEFDLDDLLLPYNSDISVYDKINNPESWIISKE